MIFFFQLLLRFEYNFSLFTGVFFEFNVFFNFNFKWEGLLMIIG